MSVRRVVSTIVMAGALIAYAPHVRADDPQPQPQQPTLGQSATDPYDSVHLRDGGFVRGRLTEIVPDDHVTIVLDNGISKRLAWSDIARIVTSTVPAAPTTTTPTGPTTPPPATPPTPTIDEPLPPPPTHPEMQWRANRPLLVSGAILFAAGYGPNLVLGLPSTVGLVGRVVVLLLTIGLPCLLNEDDHSYLCDGQHGAIQLLIPFVGPVLFVNDHPRDSIIHSSGEFIHSEERTLLYTSTALQVAGVTAILGSIIFGKKEAVPLRKAKDASLPSFFVAPLNAPASVGVSVGFNRW